MDTVTILGVGMIGGSIGQSIRNRRLARRVIGVDRSRLALDEALELGCIDEISDLTAAVSRSQLVVICTPVDQIAGFVLQASEVAASGTVITDAGSTKEAIVRQVGEKTPEGIVFVGSHPLAGSEKQGPRNARSDLFVGRLVIVTPTQATPAAAVERVTTFWQTLGSRVFTMSPRDHDDAVAVTSHLPHLVASTLANTLPDSLRGLAASGFRDTTRVASGDADLWAAIVAQNRGAVLAALSRFSVQLEQYRDAIERNDMTTLRALLAQAKATRDTIDS